MEQTLTGGSDLLRQVMFSDDTSSRSGLLQRVDARVKIVSLIGLLVVGAFLRTIPVLLVRCAITLALAAVSAIGVSSSGACGRSSPSSPSISLVVPLALTTPWTKLLASPRTLGVPRMFVLVRPVHRRR